MNKSYRQSWNIERARKYYNIPIWGEGYFDISEKGHVVACLDDDIQIDLVDVHNELANRGISLPVLIRFPQILQARVKQLCAAFNQAASSANYDIQHIAFYPVKVNQQRTVLEHILSSTPYRVGLEVGSKTELLAALGLVEFSDGRLICNGYKDRAYVRIALYAQMMGIEVTLVIENLSEIAIIEEECAALSIQPNLGVRVRLNSIASGNWQNSGGKHAKFGLNTRGLLDLIEILGAAGNQSWLKVLHFHMGSQIPDLEHIGAGLQEALCIYKEFYQQGFEIETIDVGGGLAVDYSSLQDRSYFSKSYSIEDYAAMIVTAVGKFCKKNTLPLPRLFTENGRALTAHHAVLITNVVDIEKNFIRNETNDTEDGDCLLSRKLIELASSDKTVTEQQAADYLDKINQKYLSEEINLARRDRLEQLLHQCISRDQNDPEQHEKYYCNFSIFQSLPDSWGLGQIFPIMPLSRLNEEPLTRARLHDLTCDSDGQIPLYAADQKILKTLRLHEQQNDQQYLLGFFMTGAYQEILGDIHNLFGDTHTVNVQKTVDQGLLLTEFEAGDCVQELLSSVHIDSRDIVIKIENKLNQLKNNNEVGLNGFNEIKNAFFGYTYLDSMNRPAHRIKN